MVDKQLHDQYNFGVSDSLDAYDILRISHTKLERKLCRINNLVLELNEEIERIVNFFVKHGEAVKSPGWDKLLIAKNELNQEFK